MHMYICNMRIGRLLSMRVIHVHCVGVNGGNAAAGSSKIAHATFSQVRSGYVSYVRLKSDDVMYTFL